MKANEKSISCFCFPLPKTAWAQNLILNEFADTSLKRMKQNYTSKQKNHKRQNCVNKPTTIKITEY